MTHDGMFGTPSIESRFMFPLKMRNLHVIYSEILILRWKRVSCGRRCQEFRCSRNTPGGSLSAESKGRSLAYFLQKRVQNKLLFEGTGVIFH